MSKVHFSPTVDKALAVVDSSSQSPAFFPTINLSSPLLLHLFRLPFIISQTGNLKPTLLLPKQAEVTKGDQYVPEKVFRQVKEDAVSRPSTPFPISSGC